LEEHLLSFAVQLLGVGIGVDKEAAEGVGIAISVTLTSLLSAIGRGTCAVFFQTKNIAPPKTIAIKSSINITEIPLFPEYLLFVLFVTLYC